MPTLPSLSCRTEYSWVDGKILLKNGKLTTVDEVGLSSSFTTKKQKSIEEDVEAWGEKIAAWDSQRKTPDQTEIGKLIDEYTSLGKQAAPEKVEDDVISI